MYIISREKFLPKVFNAKVALWAEKRDSYFKKLANLMNQPVANGPNGPVERPPVTDNHSIFFILE